MVIQYLTSMMKQTISRRIRDPFIQQLGVTVGRREGYAECQLTLNLNYHKLLMMTFINLTMYGMTNDNLNLAVSC